MNCFKPLKNLGVKFLLLFLVSSKLLAAPIFQVSSSASNVLVGINSKVSVDFIVTNVSGSTLTTGNIIPKLSNERTASVALSTTHCINHELANGASCTDSIEVTGLAPGANTLNFWVYAFNGAIGSKASVAINIGAGGHSIGGSITGLTTDGLQLKNNDTDELIVLNGAIDFQFATPIPTGGNYHVTVSQEPTGQTCTVNKGTGINVVSNVTDIHITCSDITFTVGGTITGLTKDGLKLKNNGDDELEVPSGSASFEFDTAISYGSGYAVTVSQQPDGQICTVNHASGTYVMADVKSVTISCSDKTYTVGGNVSGLTEPGLTLQNNSGDDLVITNAGSFEFDTPITHGSSYTVTVSQQPFGQSCTVNNGTGTNVTADVTSVSISCNDITYTVGGNVSGLTEPGLVLQNHGGDFLSIEPWHSSFQFATPITYGSSYAVSILQQPDGQSCTVNNGTGTNVTADVTDVSVNCVNALRNCTDDSTGEGDCLVFVSQTQVDGAMNHDSIDPDISACSENIGVARANCICQAEAQNAGHTGNYYAWLSTDSVPAVNNINYGLDRTYYKLEEGNSTVVADSGQLTSGLLQAPISSLITDIITGTN